MRQKGINWILWSWVMIGCSVYFLVMCYSFFFFFFTKCDIQDIVGFDAIFIYEGVIA